MNKNVLVVLGGPRKKGFSTYLGKMVSENLQSRGCKVENLSLSNLEIKPCIACDSCRKEEAKYCVLKDDMQPLYDKIKFSDLVVIACPIYWFSINAKTKLFLDRFYGFNTEKTKSLKDKKFGIILSYGDEDPYSSGAVNAIRMFEDSFKYTKSHLVGFLYKKEILESERMNNEALSLEIEKYSQLLIK